MKVRQKLAFGFIRTKIYILKIFNIKLAAREAFRLFCTPMGTRASSGNYMPAGGKKLSFTLHGRNITGYSFNQPHHRKVLLLHGFSSNATNFFKFVQPLVDKQYEVLAFDAPAHGLSEGKTVNSLEYADMIRAVIDKFGPIQAFIGHSFGGIAASLALETIPHTDSTKLVLVAPATETTSAIDSAFKMLGIKDAALIEAFNKIIMEKSGKEAAWFSIRRAMHNIKAKVLWVHDEDDDITPLADALKVKADGHSNVEFMITKGLGHRRIYRDEKVIEAIAAFL